MPGVKYIAQMRYLILVSLLLLTNCASMETRNAELQERLNKRIGKPVEALIQEIGPPTRSVPAGDPGAFLYVYEWGDSNECAVTYMIDKGKVKIATPKMPYKYCYY